MSEPTARQIAEEVNVDDAPLEYSSAEAIAWTVGYNAALATLTAALAQARQDAQALRDYIAARTTPRQGAEPQYDQSDADAFYLADENHKLRQVAEQLLAELNRHQPISWVCGHHDCREERLLAIQRTLSEATARLEAERDAARQRIADVIAEWGPMTQAVCDACEDCTPMVLCGSHSILSTLSGSTLTNKGLDRANLLAQLAEARARHAEDVRAAYRTGAAEARRQVWEDTSAEVDQILERYPNDTEALAVLVEWLRQRALPSGQTETPR